MKKKILLFIFVAAAIAAVVGYVLWNKPHETVDNKEGIQITAEALTNAFSQNEQNANAVYLNQVIEVTGKITEVSKNQDDKDVLLLESSDPLSGVQCTMKEHGNYEMDKTVTIKGFCNGYTTVVLLSDCIVSR